MYPPGDVRRHTDAPVLARHGIVFADFGTFYIINGYVSLFLCMAYIPLLMAMREVTKKDDQRIRQLMMRVKMRYRQRAARQTWGAISYSPLRYKKR
jgi:type IV secretion system protein VirB3